MSKTTAIVGAKLKLRRRDLKMSLSTLSEKTGISQTQIGRYERDESEMTITNFVLLCQALDVSPEWLLGVTDETKITGKVTFTREELQIIGMLRDMGEEKRQEYLAILKFAAR